MRDKLGHFLTKRTLRNADRRRLERVRREQFRVSRLVPLIRRMTLIKSEEREWRILLLTTPDTRSLTGRLLGDPRWERSSLYFKRMQFA